MTRFTRKRFGWFLALVLVASEASRIEASSHHSRFQTKQRGRSPLQTKSRIDEALLQTRGGWFKRKDAAADNNATQTEGANVTSTAPVLDISGTATLGDVDSTFAESTPVAQAAELRKQGKANHDEGNFVEAAEQFHNAANLLEALLGQEEDDGTIQDAWSTCRFHESLCCLKADDFEGCVEACTSLLEGDDPPPAMIRARALHRRAKAKVALDDVDGAIVDARSAAFLGDKKAIDYYGTLLRETGGAAPDAALLPTMDTSSLFESLLSKSSPQTDSGAGDSMGSDFLTSSLLGSLGGFPGLSPGGLAGAGAGKGAGGGSLAKSVLSSLSKKLEDESTHDGICRYLQSTNPMQVQSMASMAGIELPSGAASKLVNFAHGVTPKTIRRTVKISKRGLWGFQLMRKTMALLSKYRHFFFLAFLLQWTKSAVFRPIPVPKVKAPKMKGGPKMTTQPAPKSVHRDTAGGPTGGGAAQQQQQQQAGGGGKPLTPGLLNRGPGGGLAALAADR